MDRVRSIAVIAVLLPGIALISAGAVIAALLGRSPRKLQGYYVAAGRLSLRVIGVDLHVHGLEHVERDQAYIVASNHESNLDPLAIVAALYALTIRFVVKEALMRVPIFGLALKLSGNVTVDRSRSGADVKRIRQTMSERPEGVSLLFFAEGSRSRDGAFRPFKKGAFATALSAQLPILPVALAGTRAIWEPESALFHEGPIVLEIGEVIPVAGRGHEDRDALRDQTQEAVRKLRARARERLRALGTDPKGID